MSRLASTLRSRLGETQVRTARYTPVVRSFYPNVEIPEELANAPPLTIVEVEDANDVATVFELAREQTEPVYVRQGSGQVSIDSLLPFPPGAVVIDLRRLNRVRPNVEDGYVEVGAAVTLLESNRQLSPLGYEFPVSVEGVTWGGLVSVNLSGHLVDAVSGKPGDYVLGLEVVLPSGVIIDVGTHSARRPAGFDPTRLFVGSQALLGVITRLRLRLTPRAAHRSFGWAAFPTAGALVAAVRDIQSRVLPRPGMVEYVEDRYVAASEFAAMGIEGHLLLLGVHGHTPIETESSMSACMDVSREHGAKQARRVDWTEWQGLWHARANARENLTKSGKDHLISDVLDVPFSVLAKVIDELQDLRRSAEGQWDGLVGYLWAHIGSAALHPSYGCPPGWSYRRRVEVATELRGRIAEVRALAHGSVGEQGVFPEHVDWYSRRYGELGHSLIHGIKSIVDPDNILNPGRLQPTRPFDERAR